jgi:hypothetical protein
MAENNNGPALQREPSATRAISLTFISAIIAVARSASQG